MMIQNKCCLRRSLRKSYERILPWPDSPLISLIQIMNFNWNTDSGIWSCSLSRPDDSSHEKLIYITGANALKVTLDIRKIVGAGSAQPANQVETFVILIFNYFPRIINSLLVSQTALLLLSATDGAARIFLLPPGTWCLSVIRTHVELHQTGTFEGRSIDWATARPWFCLTGVSLEK